jgi:KaiC/GvpD/RAD55 family RecA-like ATPase
MVLSDRVASEGVPVRIFKTKEKREYQKAAALYLGMTETKAIDSGALIEVHYVEKIQK